jgi:hypothetical protein
MSDKATEEMVRDFVRQAWLMLQMTLADDLEATGDPVNIVRAGSLRLQALQEYEP